MHKPQIINGAQTTYALYEGYNNGSLKDDVEVLIRVIETNNKEFIDNVTLYANSQNAIRIRDLSSNDPIQIKLQKLLGDSYKYFYERKRGEFESSYPTPDMKIKNFGDDYKSKIISNEKAAQAFLAMYLDKPAQAKNEKGKIFIKDNLGFYDAIFDKTDELIAEKFLLSWKLLKYIEMRRKEYNRQYKNAEGLPDNEKKEIYKYDFLFHSEYFILNLFKDFIENQGIILNSKNNLLCVIKEIDTNSILVKNVYDKIKDELVKYIDTIRNGPSYYHNKFFKNENSIGLIRTFFKNIYNFVYDNL